MRRPGLTIANCFADGRKGLTEQKFPPPLADRWPWDHPPRDQCPKLDPKGWLHPEVCCESSKGDFTCLGSA